jgi:hypothetical protein
VCGVWPCPSFVLLYFCDAGDGIQDLVHAL